MTKEESGRQQENRRIIEDFVPTELGSAIQANVAGRPSDRELMVADNPDPANEKMNEKEKVEKPIARG